MPADLISVILIVRNGERFIRQALNSIFAQSYRPIEVLVIDGHSSDTTCAIVAEFPQARLIPQVGQGIPNAYNTGLDHAQGDYIAFLSHDDLWMPDKLAQQIAVLQADPELAFVTCHARYFREAHVVVPASFKQHLLERDVPVRNMEALLARRQVFQDLGRFDERYATAEDVDFFARAKDAGLRHQVLPEVLLQRRIHDANSSLRDAQQNSAYLLRIMRESLLRQRSARADAPKNSDEG